MWPLAGDDWPGLHTNITHHDNISHIGGPPALKTSDIIRICELRFGDLNIVAFTSLDF